MHIYQPVEADINQFVDFWSQRYQYSEEHLYDDNIGHELTDQRILDLYRWKNGTLLSEKKYNSVQRNFIQRRGELAKFEASLVVGEFLAHFDEGGAIWRIFWLHCFRPGEYPIYDQHVHRAMAFIQNGELEEIPQRNPGKIEAYIGRYMPFHEQFSTIDRRKLDRALWSFGKFLNENNFPVFEYSRNR
jgi:hypothetical protein